MIYFKIKSDIYNENNLKEFSFKYSYYKELKTKAIIRIVKNTFKKELQAFPDIDIVISFKHQQRVLGRFYKRVAYHREFKFLNDHESPFIVLYYNSIENFYTWHNVKGFKSVLFHEMGHFKQWILDQSLEHNKELKSRANIDADIDLEESINFINQTTEKK